MNENENPSGATADDVDDVEAHGMREVVIGLGAAAVLTGGAAAVMSGQDGGHSSRNNIHTTNAIDAEPSAASDLASAARGGDVGGPASFSQPGPASESIAQGVVGTLQSTTDAADDLVSPNRSLMGRVDDRVDSTIDQARDARDSVVGSVGRTVDETRATVKEEVREAGAAVREAPATLRSTVDDLRTGAITTPDVKAVTQATRDAVDATLVLAGDTVRGLTDSVMTTIARVQPGVGSDVSLKDASGWVSVTVGGEEVARAEVKDGQASVSWQAPSGDAPVAFHYSGNDLLKPASATL